MKRLLSSILIIALLPACASLAEVSEAPPDLSRRTLRISAGLAGFEYQWRECVKKGLFGACREWAMRKEFYDLTDPLTRQKLILMGFVARVPEKVLP